MVIPVKIAAASTLSAVPMVYGLRTAKNLGAEISILKPDEVVDAFVGGMADIALLPTGCVHTLQNAKIITDFCVAPTKGEEEVVAAEWGGVKEAPVAAVWVARENVAPEVLDAVEEALTLGVERIYEALLSLNECPKVEDYTYLTSKIDYLFDLKKHKALEAHWKKLKKATAHANPG